MTTRLYREILRRATALNLEPAVVSKKAGLGESYIRDLGRKGSKEPHRSKLAKIAKVLACAVDDLTFEAPRTPIRDQNSVVIFEVNTGAQGGHGGDGDIEITRDVAVGEFSFPANGFRERFGSGPAGVFIDAMRGDSQMPTIYPGEPLMIDSRDRSVTPPGTMFLCWDGNGMVFKRLEIVHRSDPPKVRLLSDNPRYPTYERLAEEVVIYGRIIGRWAKM